MELQHSAGRERHFQEPASLQLAEQSLQGRGRQHGYKQHRRARAQKLSEGVGESEACWGAGGVPVRPPVQGCRPQAAADVCEASEPFQSAMTRSRRRPKARRRLPTSLLAERRDSLALSRAQWAPHLRPPRRRVLCPSRPLCARFATQKVACRCSPRWKSKLLRSAGRVVGPAAPSVTPCYNTLSALRL